MDITTHTLSERQDLFLVHVSSYLQDTKIMGTSHVSSDICTGWTRSVSEFSVKKSFKFL